MDLKVCHAALVAPLLSGTSNRGTSNWDPPAPRRPCPESDVYCFLIRGRWWTGRGRAVRLDPQSPKFAKTALPEPAENEDTVIAISNFVS